MFGPLDKFFDFNGDGKLSAFERGAELDFLDQMSREDQKGQNSDSDHDYNWPWDDRKEEGDWA